MELNQKIEWSNITDKSYEGNKFGMLELDEMVTFGFPYKNNKLMILPKIEERPMPKRTIVAFHKSDIEDAATTESGLKIVSGGNISDIDLMYEPQKCYVISTTHEKLKEGDCVYTDFDVWTAGRGGGQDIAGSQLIEQTGDWYVMWCFNKQVVCKFENGQIVALPHKIICDPIQPEEMSKGGIIYSAPIDTNKKCFPAKVRFIAPETCEDFGTEIKPDDVIYCLPHSDMRERIEKKEYLSIIAKDVVGIK